MQKITFILTVLQPLYLTSSVESLQGQNIRQVSYGDLSFVASLQYLSNGQTFCTGVLITKFHLITTSNCLHDEKPSEIQVFFQIVSPLEAIITDLIYSVDSWQSYYEWTITQRLLYNEPDPDGIAVMKLKEEVNHINPARLSELTKQQAIGLKVVITGWKNGISNDGLLMSIVHLRNDEDCDVKQSMISHNSMRFGPRVICNYAKTLPLLEEADGGAPIVDIDKNIIGLALGRAPDLTRAPNNYSDAFKYYEINVHFSIDYYRQFIVSTTGYKDIYLGASIQLV